MVRREDGNGGKYDNSKSSGRWIQSSGSCSLTRISYRIPVALTFRACLYFFFACVLLFTSCENNLKDVERISSKKAAVPVDRSYGVEMIYSDSAVVKAKIITPELLHFKTLKPYYEMPRGVTVIFFDPDQKETSRVTSDYAISHEAEKLVELRKNVVATNPEGKVFKSDELFWDENKKRFYSNKTVSITSKNGDVLYGTKFESDANFNNPVFTNATGNFTTGADLNQPK